MFKAGKPGAVSSTFARQIVEFNRPRRMGPDNVLVLYRSGDAVGQSIAQVYQAKRAVPAANAQAITLPWDPSAGSNATGADMDAAVGQVSALCLARDVYSILLCGWWPIGSGTRTLNELFGFAHLFASIGSGGAFSGWAGYSTYPYVTRWHPDFNADYAAWLLRVDYVVNPVGGSLATAPYFGVPPKNRLSVVADNTQVFYPTFRLEGPPDTDQLAFCTRIVNDSIAAEQAAYPDLGTVLVDGSSSIMAGRPVHKEITEFGIPVKDFRWRQLNTPVEYGGAYPSLADTWTTPSRPEATGFTAQSDVFLKYIGSEAYYGGKTVPETSSDYQYRTGAVTAFGQSFGYQPPVWADCGWGTQNPKWQIAIGIGATGSGAHPQAINSIGVTSTPFGITSTGTSPTVDVQADGTFLLKESGTQVGTVPLQTTFNAYLSISLPAGWAVNTSLPGSRALSAVRAGAVCSMGAIVEPGATGMPVSYHLAQGLWSGDCLGELSFKMHSPDAYYAINQVNTVGFTILGDPLYRPFGWRIR